MDKPKRVLHIFAALDQGGVENFVMNVYRNIDREKIQFDFAMTSGRKSFFDDEVKKLGGRVFYFDKPATKISVYKRNLSRIINEEGPFVAVHSHCYFFSGVILKICKNQKIVRRISHSHETYKGQKYTLKRKVYEKVMRRLLLNNSTNMFGCSKQACLHLYGKNCFKDKRTKVINNAIDIKNFTCNENSRNEKRKELGIKENQILIGHTGRFADQKNHDLLIDIFKSVHDKNKNTKLLLIGDGPLRKQIEEKIEKLGLNDDVIFAGLRSNVNELLSAMDMFVLPSKYEGLPVAMIEAQANGLPCVISSTITDDTVVTDLVTKVSPSESSDKWAETILKQINVDRKNTSEDIKRAGFDIIDVSNMLEQIYLQ